MRSSLLAIVLAAPLTFSSAVSSCANRVRGQGATPPSAPQPHAEAPAPKSSASAEPTAKAAPVEEPVQPKPRIGAIAFHAPITSEMEWPSFGSRKDKGDKGVRLGYLRQGTTVPVIPEPHKKANCPDGWYELAAGGYVCGKYASTDLNHPRIKAAHPPDRVTILPYQYGVNIRQGEPLYRQVPSKKQRTQFEPWLFPAKRPPAPAPASSSDAPAPTAPVENGPTDAPIEEDEKPWFLRDTDGGVPSVTLDELKSEGGIVARRMVKGFIVSLDEQFEPGGNAGKWWRTTSGYVTPIDPIIPTHIYTEFHGVWLTNESSGTYSPEDDVPAVKIEKLPIAFVIGYNVHRWELSEDKKKAKVSPGPLPHFTTVGLTDKKALVGNWEYWETVEGYWIRANDATKTEPGAPPSGLEPGEKWIDISLKRQTLVAFEGDTPVFATIISSGKKDHDTPPGSFRIREKHVSSTMDGDADVASDGPYSIEDVPYIQYFNAGYALHGAFWHTQFGRVKSHGCINLAPWDARALFAWTGPTLPEGWHGVFSTKDKLGTRVIVREK